MVRMAEGSSVKVAVRVRPFTEREKCGGTRNIISMCEKATTIEDPTNEGVKRDFIFDKSYWSHDGYEEDVSGYLNPKTNSNYADQKKIFKDLGEDLVGNAWCGYNCSIFAYGQTGSGKSYSIMGYNENKGIVPMLCEKLFRDIATEEKESTGISYQVKFSMIEIYNEEIRDLLSRQPKPRPGLRIRESKRIGFYVENCTEVPVSNVKEVNVKIEEGNRERTIASTQMNDMSSRAHTIVKLEFSQISLKEKETRTSIICMVDLAGSERAKQSGASGQRFVEATNINKSLLTLGSVIKSLCDEKKGISSHTPYRDSVLTMLLKNALGGNSKTVMIATISPSSENYEQTLSTLRYADRAKSITNKAVINKGRTDTIIKELLEEKEKLLRELKDAQKTNTNAFGYTLNDVTRMEEEIENIKKEKDNMEKAWETKLKQARLEVEEQLKEETKRKDDKKNFPHLLKLNEDPTLSGYVYYPVKTDAVVQIGNPRSIPKPQIILYGPSIVTKHGNLKKRGNDIYITAVDGRILHNGNEMQKNQQVKLTHYDRLLFGDNYNHGLFYFVHPKQAKGKTAKGEPTYETASQEIAINTRVNVDVLNADKYLREQIVRIETGVREANTMANEMDRNVTFDVILVSGIVLGRDSNASYVFVKVLDRSNGCEYFLSRNDFLDQYANMVSNYYHYLEKGTEWNKDDPFAFPSDTPTRIGVAFVSMLPIAYMIDDKNEKYELFDYIGEPVGHLTVSYMPCDIHGKESKCVVQNPHDLVEKRIQFKIKISKAIGLPERFKSSWCTFQLLHENECRNTKEVVGRNPDYEYEELVTIPEVTHGYIEYFQKSHLMIEIWGKQKEGLIGQPSRPKIDLKKTLEDKDRQIKNLQTELEKTKSQLKIIQGLASTSRQENLASEIMKVFQ